LDPKNIGVIILTFQGHVTSSVMTIRFLTNHFLLVVLWNRASITNGFRDSFILVPIDSSILIDDYLQAVDSDFCSRTHRLATIHMPQRDRQTTDATL